ncbi:hypothetical protein Msil_1087 [Methylocella silvestris BL2]|uniref:Surface antigen domain-containing protein n=1 Tax=Methylocella silvestris (strain DSM 15510 / CIP 108128 / LMG 27833 / NCIMB 13906 / BL2) TaxID=395965 RepID=B8ELR2_METSB|nr:RT0821/Lpp0805 family surface protein [Methylocella silvestris]ACK50056.1 hypothetical protein Msil_1087 [Methylocella silvestris BL2]
MRHYHQLWSLSRIRRSGLLLPGSLAPEGPAGSAFRLLPLMLVGACLSGCAVSLPIATLTSSKDDVTGSIESSPLERLLDAEDWRRAKAALSTALDPQGNGAEVGWDNPESGAKGSFAPLGKAYPSDAKICRAFRTDVQRKGATNAMDGVACADKNGDWGILEIRPAKKA